jgi:photosystem II stability/assembly factor-like uncharacterized protein
VEVNDSPPARAPRLVAATGDGVGVLSEREGTWRAALELEGSGAACVALDPRSPDSIYAGSRRGGVWRSDDGGASFGDAGLGDHQVYSIAVSPVDGAVYAGCEPSMLWRSRDRGASWEELSALREIPSAPTWSFPPRPWTSHVRWIAPSPNDADRLLAGIELGGVMLTEDGGATWMDHRPGAQPDCHALAWHPSAEGRAYEAGGGGAAWSFDGGRSWRAADEGRDRNYTWALAVDPDDPERWYLSASTGPGAAHRGGDPRAHLYRWEGEGPWREAEAGLPQPLDSMPYALAASDGDTFVGLADGRLYRSTDRGESWEPLPLEGEALPALIALAAG